MLYQGVRVGVEIFEMLELGLFSWHNHLILLQLIRQRDQSHLKLRSHRTTFIWDNIHVRQHSLRPYSFETTIIWCRIHFKPRSFANMFIVHFAQVRQCWFSVAYITFVAIYFTSFEGDWKFSRRRFGCIFLRSFFMVTAWWIQVESQSRKLDFHWDLLCCEYVSSNRAFYLVHQKIAITYFDQAHCDECEYLFQQYLHFRLFPHSRLCSCFKPVK